MAPRGILLDVSCDSTPKGADVMDAAMRERFNEIADGLYGEARKMNRDMHISKETYDFVLDYGISIGEEFNSLCEEGTFSSDQVCSYLEYYGTICAFWEVCGTEVPAIEKLARHMDQVFISKIDPRTTGQA